MADYHIRMNSVNSYKLYLVNGSLKVLKILYNYLRKQSKKSIHQKLNYRGMRTSIYHYEGANCSNNICMTWYDYMRSTYGFRQS